MKDEFDSNPEAADEFEHLLRNALQSRPEAIPFSNLAERVMKTAARERVAPAQPTRLVRVGKWLTSLAACAMLAAILIMGALRIAGIEASRLSFTSSAVATSTSSSGIGPLLFVGVGSLAAAMVYLALQSSFARAEDLSHSVI